MQFISVPQSSLKVLAIEKLKRKQLVAVQNSHHYPQLTLEYSFYIILTFYRISIFIKLYTRACWSWCIRKRQIMAGTYIRKRLGSEYMEGKCNQELPGRTIDYSPGYIYILHTIYIFIDYLDIFRIYLHTTGWYIFIYNIFWIYLHTSRNYYLNILRIYLPFLLQFW